MRITLQKNKLTFLLLFLLSILVALIGEKVLPQKFFIDANTIVFDYYSEAGFKGSYPITMSFYKYTQLGKLPFNIVGVIQLFFYYLILYKIGIPKDFHILTIKNVVVYLAFLMIGIFIAMPSKEFITFLFISQIVFLFQSKKIGFDLSLLYSFISLLLFGIFFRSYFALIPFISILLYFISKIKYTNRTFGIIMISVLVIILFSALHYLAKGEFFSDLARNLVNEIRQGSEDANSMIVPPLEPNGLLAELVNTFYSFLSVNFPIVEYKHLFSPRIFLFIIWQILFTIIFIVRFSWTIKDPIKNNRVLWIFYFLFSYLAIQSVFEPDLGSAVRHKIGILPLFYYVFYYDSFSKKI